MSNVKKKYNVNIKGILNINEDGRIVMSIEDIGDMPLDEILNDFDGREVKISVVYDEDYAIEDNLDIDFESEEMI
jgi:hypothetical protein